MRVSEEKPAMTLLCSNESGEGGLEVCVRVCGGADNWKAAMVRMMLL